MRVLLLACLISPVPVAAASFTPLGDLPGGAFESVARGVSADGSVVVGYSISGADRQAFRWTQAGGLEGLGFLPNGGQQSDAFGISADGETIVGQSGFRAIRWTSTSGMLALGSFTGGNGITVGTSIALAVSGDGSAITGYGSSVRGFEGFRWTAAGGLTGFTDGSATFLYTMPWGISGDGQTVVGAGSVGSFRVEAPRTVLQSIGDGGAYGASWDGSVIVGQRGAAGNYQAFRWTSETGQVGLGSLFGFFSSSAMATSADGAVIAGYSDSSAGRQAVVWTAQTGMQRLFDVLSAQGVTGLDGWRLEAATAMSPDGTWIAGFGYNPLGHVEAFVANTAPVPIPAAAWLLATAIGGLAWRCRR